MLKMNAAIWQRRFFFGFFQYNSGKALESCEDCVDCKFSDWAEHNNSSVFAPYKFVSKKYTLSSP
jgi:hypothetical protein